MGKSFVVPLWQEDSGNSNAFVKRTGATVTLRYETDPNTVIHTLSEIGTSGVYKKDNVSDGDYLVYINGANSGWGTIKHGDQVGLQPDAEGHYNLAGKRIYNIGDPASGIDGFSQDYADDRYVLASEIGNYVTLTTVQTISGQKSFSVKPISSAGMHFALNIGGTNYPSAYYEDEVLGNVYKAPPNWYDFAVREYVDRKFGTVTVPPNQYGTAEVSVIGGVTEHEGKIYRNIANATAYLTTLTPSKLNRAWIHFRDNNDYYYKCELNDMKDYVNWIGYLPAIINQTGNYQDWDNAGTIIAVAQKTVVAKMAIKNLSLIFGNSTANWATNQTGARSYTGLELDCVFILAFNDVELNFCTLNNVIGITSSGKKFTLNNCTMVGNNQFNAVPTIGSGTNPNFNASDFTWNVPNDPTAYIPA